MRSSVALRCACSPEEMWITRPVAIKLTIKTLLTLIGRPRRTVNSKLAVFQSGRPQAHSTWYLRISNPRHYGFSLGEFDQPWVNDERHLKAFTSGPCFASISTTAKETALVLWRRTPDYRRSSARHWHRWRRHDRHHVFGCTEVLFGGGERGCEGASNMRCWRWLLSGRKEREKSRCPRRYRMRSVGFCASGLLSWYIPMEWYAQVDDADVQRLWKTLRNGRRWLSD